MAKQIAIREEVYNKLLKLKVKDMSFSKVIEEMIEKKGDLSDFIGIWDKKKADEVKRRVKKFREKVDGELKDVLLRN